MQEELASLSAKFDDNVLDSENAWAHYVDDAAGLAGVPADVVATARAAAQAAGRDGYQLTLRYPCYMPVMQYAEDRALRALVHRAAATLASDLGASPDWDNTPVIARILELRREEARLLGYANYADLSLVPKMAQRPHDVLAFLRDLARRTRPFAERDYAELVDFARRRLGIDDVAAWDLQYAAEKLKAERFSFSEQEVKQYFPEDRVLAGLFRVVETIYGVHVKRRNRGGVASVGAILRDLRRARRACRPVLSRSLCARRQAERRMDGRCDQPAPCARPDAASGRVPDLQLLGSGRRQARLFHALRSDNAVPRVRPRAASAVDAASTSRACPDCRASSGMPSSCRASSWRTSAGNGTCVSHMTAHADTGAPLPRALFDRMLSARNFGSGMAMVRQLELALFDMLLHSAYTPGGEGAFETPQAVLDAVRREIAVVPRPAYDRFMHGFGHIFAGGYAAGYYSYKWAEVLSADAFSLFEERGVMSPEVGARFRDEVLARGGSRPALESFVAFRGRAPQLDALLRHNGMVET